MAPLRKMTLKSWRTTSDLSAPAYSPDRSSAASGARVHFYPPPEGGLDLVGGNYLDVPADVHRVAAVSYTHLTLPTIA